MWTIQGAFGIYQGASNHEELHNLMKATLMIRRLKKDVLSELPVKRRQQVDTGFCFAPAIFPNKKVYDFVWFKVCNILVFPW